MSPTDSSSTPFTGPIFLVGMPRSGTKLLRNLLNQHSQIQIPKIETEFYPMWAAQWNDYGDLSDWETFHTFYQAFLNLPYARYCADEGHIVDARSWFEACNAFTPAAVFEALIRLDADAPADNKVIWGDKSPSYIRHMSQLKADFPTARFIHLIRDVRDYALSIRSAWNKNMLRAAQRWADDITAARIDGASLDHAYFEIRYEDLLEDPSTSMERISAFLNVAPEEAMMTPPSGTENLGDARSAKGILKSNTGKYLTRMTASERRRIESVSAHVLRALDYPCEYEGPPKRLSRARLLGLQMLDGLNLVRFRTADKGLSDALSFYTKYFRSSGNRY